MPLARQRTQRFGEKSEVLDLHRELVGFRAKERSFDGHPIAGIEVLIKRPFALAQRVFSAIGLNARRFFGENQERGFAEFADRDDASGDLDARLLGLELLR